MHIPDGYLSPTTCALGYAMAAPFWHVALARVKRLLQTRLVPLLAAVSAFSFVVMMFNLPIPGGTTAHAVGMAVAAIVLGPWAAILAISIALMIQALFFGDGGITAYGVNCVNMAIIGSLVAYAVYQAIAGRAPIASSRRISPPRSPDMWRSMRRPSPRALNSASSRCCSTMRAARRFTRPIR